MGHHLQAFLVRHGLAAVAIGAAFEGDLTLILAGVVARLGVFDFPAALVAGALGGFVADCGWYGLGRLRGRRLRAGRLYRRVGPSVERMAQRIGPWQLVASRFVYGTKAASMVFWGLQGLSFPRFVLIDGLGCLLGAGVFGGIGYLLSGSATALLGKVQRLELWLLAAVVAGIVVVVAMHRIASRELEGSDAD